jgi:hypothetical protein
MATLKKQVWTKQLMQNFYPDTSFLKFAKDFSSLVENDKIHMAEAGLDPNVLVNNTTYPINVIGRTDNPLEFELDLFETENTIIREPEAVELAYSKLDSVLYGHKSSLRTKTAEKAAHAFAPNGDTTNTPVIETTGDPNEGVKSINPKDILKLKRRFDSLDIPLDKRYLILDPRHTEDLILQDMKLFKDITDFVNGKPRRFAGFNILEFTRNPRYNSDTLQKVGFTANATVTDTFCSFAFYGDEVMKADGNVKLYQKKDDPLERATIVGFDKRFIALPIRNKAIGAIVAKKSA